MSTTNPLEHRQPAGGRFEGRPLAQDRNIPGQGRGFRCVLPPGHVVLPGTMLDQLVEQFGGRPAEEPVRLVDSAVACHRPPGALGVATWTS
jgi:hypothetical protein